MTKFEDGELGLISTELSRERAEWRYIQEKKKLIASITQPYNEQIHTFNLKLTKNKEPLIRADAKRRLSESLLGGTFIKKRAKSAFAHRPPPSVLSA
jgi:hypothetical protein